MTLLRLALYQPDIAANTGAMMRLCACLGVAMDIIEPCGFPFDDKRMRRAGMDYIDHVTWQRHRSWDDFQKQKGVSRLVLLTTKAARPYTEFSFQKGDILMVGRESAGVPDDVHNAAAARVVIPMAPPMRSLNVAISAGIVLSEAVRQLGATI
ncbi:MAG: tRNA (cytidine(34)-2'-O)-methyltransferase [Alphaproteobacteria bacterium]|nr:tRNA (cytidine(34)-2'-O)-methyltransferase [Alphaproteobacteria bacterium]MBV8548186.1 tRNA (cytidine(34)-2'-O)-methyltransferase [Alphaproteobacteria bacterium]